MVRLAEFVLRHRRLVMLFWLVMFVVGGIAAGQVTDRLTVDFSLPGQPGYETEKQLLGDLRQRRLQPADDRGGHRARGHHGRGAARQDHAGLRRRSSRRSPAPGWSTYADTKNPVFVTDDGRTTYALVYPKPFESFTDVGPDVAMKPILEQASQATGFDFGVTGYNLLAAGHRRPRGAERAGRDPARRRSARWRCCCSCSRRSSPSSRCSSRRCRSSRRS